MGPGPAGWRDDFDRAVATAHLADPISYAAVVNTKYSAAITCGLLLPDDAALGEIDQALRVAERSADDVALGIAGWRWASRSASRLRSRPRARTGAARAAP